MQDEWTFGSRLVARPVFTIEKTHWELKNGYVTNGVSFSSSFLFLPRSFTVSFVADFGSFADGGRRLEF